MAMSEFEDECVNCRGKRQFIDNLCNICYSDLSRLESRYRPYMQQLVCTALMGGDWLLGSELSDIVNPERFIWFGERFDDCRG